ncbi:hypothetical protein Ahy_A03g011289 [Arachis hypogaea]|uniref:Endonuclease/exonuclease/phosphatase domain-containing protein n=1 Tax=Arachis hypogaea TaxID=3818 RepID=A0A445DQA2_ARAHY|nr:hypothetical protein Ahy_A03g011289 [Arachis hypogaea]
MGGGISKQQEWREEGEEQAREQQNPDRESGEEQSSKESRIRAERVLQQKIREESVWENQMRRKEEMTDAEEQVEEVLKEQRINSEIRERNNEWANNKKAQKGERRYEVQKSGENEQIRDTGPNTRALHQQAWNVEGNWLNNYITEEEEEVNSYKIEDWKLGPEKKKKKNHRPGIKKTYVSKNKGQTSVIEGKENQELLKDGTEDNALRKLSKEAQNGEHEFVGQHVKPGENVYYVENGSTNRLGTRLAKKLELKLNLKRKRENKQVPLLIYREWKEKQEDREPKKVKNSITTLDIGEYQLAKHVSGNSEWCDNYIKASININNILKWQGVFVYGNPVFQKRRKLWQELTVSNRSREEPQAYLGDFNNILSQDEKVGIHPQQRIYLDTFRRFVDDNGLMDIGLKGSRYTWYINLRNNFITRERLDRVLNVILKAAPAISLDYCALILETQPRDRIKKEFRFEAFWTEHEECKEVIRRSWQQDHGNRNCWNQFTRKRSRCKRELTEWSRRKFKRKKRKVSYIKYKRAI